MTGGLIWLLFLLLPYPIWGQYAGGNGDGYARSGFTYYNGTIPYGVAVGPNPVAEGAEVAVRVSGVESTVGWVLYDACGRRVAEGGDLGLPRVYRFRVGMDVRPGVYLLDVRTDGRKSVHKLMVYRP